MDLFKKFILIISLLLVIAALFPLSSRAATSDTDVDYTYKATTTFEIEKYQQRLQDTYINFIHKHNSGLLDTITNYFNNGYFFYITLTRNTSKNDNYDFTIIFYSIGNVYDVNLSNYGDTFFPYNLYDNARELVPRFSI